VKQVYHEAVGRRKTAVARVRISLIKASRKTSTTSGALTKSSFVIIINEKPFTAYFPFEKLQRMVEEPLKKLKAPAGVEVSVKVKGGGISGQADAVRLGIARALKKYMPEILPELRSAGLLTRDPRMKERKKPGLKGARKGQQWSKR